MSVALLVITDGRDEYLERTVESALASLRGDITEWWMYDDTGDDSYRGLLAVRHPGWQHLSAGPRQGFGGAIRAAWSCLARASSADHVFHLEADFVFPRPVDVHAMAAVLDAHPHLGQLALRRQPWNSAEAAAGGIVEMHPDAYTERHDAAGSVWLEHRVFWTTNPCLYRRELCSAGWPAGAQSEGRFGLDLFRRGLPWGVPGEDVRSAFWGARDSGVAVEHIGYQRAGVGY